MYTLLFLLYSFYCYSAAATPVSMIQNSDAQFTTNDNILTKQLCKTLLYRLSTYHVRAKQIKSNSFSIISCQSTIV